MPDLNAVLFRALAAALELDPGSAEAARILRRAYVNPAPAPPGEGEDAVYYYLLPDAREPVREETGAAGGVSRLFLFAPYLLRLVFYGPGAETLAWRVRRRFFLDGYGQPRRILRAAGVYPVPRPAAPSLVWEEAEKFHRPRADLTLPLRIAALETAESSPAAVPPEIPVHLP